MKIAGRAQGPPSRQCASAGSAAPRRKAHARTVLCTEDSASLCESAIRGFSPARSSVYKHTERPPVRGNPKGSGAEG